MDSSLTTMFDFINLAWEQGGEQGIKSACVQALAAMRPMDRAGAWAVLDRDSAFMEALASQAEAQDLMDLLEQLAGRQDCLACGTCCRTSSPTLYKEDQYLIGPDGIERRQLYTLRKGEMAYSARLGRAAPLENELIKLRERPSGGCVFLKDSLCQIYESRPLQCRWLRCWDGTHAGQLEDRPRLTRQDVFAGEQRSLNLIREYEIKMPGDQLARAFQAAAEGFQQIALDMIEMDLRLRAGVQASFGYHFDSLDLLWGRSALEVAKSHGLSLTSSQEGSPVLARQ